MNNNGSKIGEPGKDQVEDLRETQLATLNILDDFNAEKMRLEETQRAAINILDDFNAEKSQLERTQRATLNILDDFNAEKMRLEEMQRGVLNILDDIDGDREQLRDAQKALLNILDDLNQSSEELRKAHDVLDLRVRERTAELARSNAELQQFAYVASHDLQEPLRTVTNYLELLGKEYAPKLDGEALEYMKYAVQGGLRMKLLIDDLLAYSRVESQAKPMTLVNMNEVVDQAIDNLRSALEESGAGVRSDHLPTLAADGIQMVQIMTNLLANSIKFRSKEPPRIEISSSERAHEWVFSVRDNGIGINPVYTEKVFQMFVRLHSGDKHPGTGIGLPICRRIIGRHGGRIWVESEEGKGATFFFTISKRMERR